MTTQIDWPENTKVRQAQGETFACYYQDQISMYAMRVWIKYKGLYLAAMSDVADHRPPRRFY